MLVQKQYEIDETKFLKNVFTISSALKGLSTGEKLDITITKLPREATSKHHKSLRDTGDYIHKNVENSICTFNIHPDLRLDKIFLVKNTIMAIENFFWGVLSNIDWYAEAKRCYEKALKIQEKDYGCHPYYHS